MTLIERCNALGFDNEEQYLRSKHWKKFREEYRASNLPQRCLVCGSAKVFLHHNTYHRLGCEKLTDVDPLCYKHHKGVHKWMRDNKNYNTRLALEAITGKKIPWQKPMYPELKAILDKLDALPLTEKQKRRRDKLAKQRKARALEDLYKGIVSSKQPAKASSSGLTLLIHQALTVQGERYKQWYLIQLAELLKINIHELDVDEGLDPVQS